MGAEHHGELPFVVEVSGRREHRFHLAPAGAAPFRVGRQPQTNPAARGRPQGATRAHEELTVEARMGRMDHAHATTIKELPHQGLMGTLENLSDGPLGLAIPARARNAHEHLVSVHGGA